MISLGIHRTGRAAPVTVQIDNKTVYLKKLMGEHHITSDFIHNSASALDVTIGDYITYPASALWNTASGENYYINQLPSVVKLNNSTFQYKIDFQSNFYNLNKKLFKDGANGLTDFSYAGQPLDFVNKIITNVNEINPTWASGTCSTGIDKTLQFTNESCISALSKVAEAYKMEYDITNKTISLYDSIAGASGYSFKYGAASGLYKLTRDQVLNQNIITRCYGFGGTTNIPDTYRNANKRLIFAASGMAASGYLDSPSAQALYGVIEGVFTDDTIFPERTGTIEAVTMNFDAGDSGAVARVDKVTKNSTASGCDVACNGLGYQMPWNTNPIGTVSDFVSLHALTYYGTGVTLVDNEDGSMTFTANVAGTDFTGDSSITAGQGTVETIIANDAGSGGTDLNSNTSYIEDTTINFNLNDYKIGNQTQSIIFKSGVLSGVQCEVSKFDYATKRIYIKAFTDSDGYTQPNATHIPAISDTYTLVNMIMPQTYIDTSEATLQAATQRYLDENSAPHIIYTLDIDPKDAKLNSISLDAGDRVTVVDSALSINQLIRISSIEYPLINPYKIKVVLANPIVPYTLQDRLVKAASIITKGALFSTSSPVKGMVPGANNAGASYFLNAKGAWAVPPVSSAAAASGTSSASGYPSAGIALSTGSGWAASITNQSVNWNAAYNWGDWAAAVALKAPIASPTFTGTVTTASLISTNHKIETVSAGTQTLLSLVVPNATNNNSVFNFSVNEADSIIPVSRIAAVYGAANDIELQFATFNASGLGVRMVIDKDGKVGMAGMLEPDYDLTVGTDAKTASSIISINSAENQDKGLIFSSAGVSKYIIYNPASSADLRFHNGTADKMILSSTGRLSLDGGIHVGGTSDPGDNNLWIDGIAQEPNFNAGWQGTNWQIQADGDAEFNNVRIRGGLSVYELIINQLHYQNGGLIIGAGAGKIATITTATVGSEVMTFQDPEGNSMVPFTAGSIIMCQRVDISKTVANGYTGDVVKKIVRQVASVASMEVTLTTTTGWLVGDDTGIFEVGDELCAIGHTTNTDLDSSIYLSATDANNPFMRIYDGVNTYGKFSLGDKTTIKLQLGNLASLASYDIIPASPGYGLYSDNVYLNGRIVLPSAGMTNEGASGTDIRIWAGDSYANRATAPFRVDQDGSLTATGVAELGTNSVNVDGAISNVAIQGPDIWENAYNGDNGLHINRLGYNGGDTQYKTLTVWDGKYRDKLFVVLGGDPNVIELGNENDERELEVSIVGNIEKVWGSQFIYAYSGVSNTAILTEASTYTELGTAYVLKRTITLGAYIKPNRTLRIRIDLKASSNTSYAQIYRNGSPVGTERVTASVVYVTYYEDIGGWFAGDTIELYMKSTAGNTASATEFKVCGDMVTTIQNEITGGYS